MTKLKHVSKYQKLQLNVNGKRKNSRVCSNIFVKFFIIVIEK